MAGKEMNVVDYAISVLEQNTRGTQIFVYGVAGIGLAVAVAKIRPVSKFSRAADVPRHFINNKEPLRGRIVDCNVTQTTATLFLDHKPHIKIPLWHSNKTPLPVQVWGIKPVGGNTYSWLQSVAIGSEATVVPVRKENEDFIGQVRLHLPNYDTALLKEGNTKIALNQDIDIAERLVELGMSTINKEVARCPLENYTWWTPWLKNKDYISSLHDAQKRAISNRNDYWRDVIPKSLVKRVLLGVFRSNTKTLSAV